MADATQQVTAPGAVRDGNGEQYDALVIGAGVTGLYSLYRFRELGFSVMGCCPARSTNIAPSFPATKSASGGITRKWRKC